MSSVSKEIIDFTDPDIPVKAFVSLMGGTVEVAPHLHKEIEWLYMLSGTMTVRVMDEVYTLKQGEISIINSYVVHATDRQDPDSQICLLQFNPDVLVHNPLVSEYKYALPFLCQDRFRHLLIRPTEARKQREIAMLLTETADEFRRKAVGYEMMIKSNLYRLLAILFRNALISCVDSGATRKENMLKAKLTKIIDYVENHYEENLDIKQMAGLVGMNPDYFSRIFKAETGQSFVHYLNEVRVSIAERLLLTTDRLITDILVETGFSSLSYFNRIFKKYKHCSPSEYRRRASTKSFSSPTLFDCGRS